MVSCVGSVMILSAFFLALMTWSSLIDSCFRAPLKNLGQAPTRLQWSNYRSVTGRFCSKAVCRLSPSQSKGFLNDARFCVVVKGNKNCCVFILAAGLMKVLRLSSKMTWSHQFDTVMDRRQVVIIGYCFSMHNLVTMNTLEYCHYLCVLFIPGTLL